MSTKDKAIEGDGHHSRRATEDDVEGHNMAHRALEPDGIHTARKATEDDDVEGHSFTKHTAVEPDGIHTARKATEDDDVEGHNIGVMNPILARELSRARERDVQREASRNSLIGEAKRALGRKR
jgi:hypothetical protein